MTNDENLNYACSSQDGVCTNLRFEFWTNVVGIVSKGVTEQNKCVSSVVCEGSC